MWGILGAPGRLCKLQRDHPSQGHQARGAPSLGHVTQAQLDPWKLGLGPEARSHLPAPGQPSQLSFTLWDNSPRGSGKLMLPPHWLCFPFQALMRCDNGCRKVCKCKSIRSICSGSLSYLPARLESKGNASEVCLDLGSLLSPKEYQETVTSWLPGPLWSWPRGKLSILICSSGMASPLICLHPTTQNTAHGTE